MREALFRGKDTESGEWLYGWVFGEKDKSIVEINTKYVSEYGVDAYHASPVIPETVGQYTGLDDKNGVKIFEGDVVKAEHDNYYNPEHEDEPEYSAWIGSIEYEEGYYQINTNCEYCPAINNIRTKTIEIIGNIHDNPELVGGE